MSMCLDRECWTLLQQRAMALRLLQYRGILLKAISAIAVSFGYQSPYGSFEIPKDRFKCFKVLFGRRCLIPRTHAYNKHQVGSAGSEVH
uniref:Uncharacterized protein n=1 Tax=Tanacetum cinerariifolium TaxID=118510 RepID=A0A699L3V3_TANCI|nr:hypothetical protein [Tanacetum cinerariifolium]